MLLVLMRRQSNPQNNYYPLEIQSLGFMKISGFQVFCTIFKHCNSTTKGSHGKEVSKITINTSPSMIYRLKTIKFNYHYLLKQFPIAQGRIYCSIIWTFTAFHQLFTQQFLQHFVILKKFSLNCNLIQETGHGLKIFITYTQYLY